MNPIIAQMKTGYARTRFVNTAPVGAGWIGPGPHRYLPHTNFGQSVPHLEPLGAA